MVVAQVESCEQPLHGFVVWDHSLDQLYAHLPSVLPPQRLHALLPAMPHDPLCVVPFLPAQLLQSERAEVSTMVSPVVVFWTEAVEHLLEELAEALWAVVAAAEAVAENALAQ